MHFTNLQVPADELPKLEEVEFTALQREHLTVLRIANMLSFIVLAIIAAVIVYFQDALQDLLIISLSAIGLIALFVFTSIAIKMDFDNSGYAIREKDMLYRSGWLRRKTRIVPISRIQHVSMQSGPLERMYNLASVSIFTAGSERADFTIKGITSEKALQVKDWITGQLHGTDREQ